MILHYAAATPDQFDFFVSYARADNAGGWVSQFVDELLAERRQISGGRELTCFFDKQDIRSLCGNANLTNTTNILRWIG